MPLDRTVKDLLARAPGDVHVALVGASNATHKYGSIILRDLTRKGYVVHPVNPHEGTVASRPAYPTVADIPPEHRIDIVNLVVPPAAARTVLEGLDPARHPVVWLQPGAFDRQVAEYAAARFPHAVIGDCIMVETR